jgi:hypothetical protein
VGDGMWWVWALLALVVAGGVGWMLKARGRTAPSDATGAAPPPVPANVRAQPEAPPASPAPAARGGPIPAQAPRPVPPAAPRPVAPRSVPTPAPVAAAPTPKAVAAAPMVVPPPARPTLPRVLRFELRDAQPQPVMVVERADGAAWDLAGDLPSTPVQRELLGGLLAQASQLAGTPADVAPACYAVHLRCGAAWALARGEIALGAMGVVPPGAIDPASAPDFAAATLALHAARRPLPELHAQVGETKTAAAALHPKLVAQTEGRAKSLMQDLTRYLREAEENYAGAIRKPVFLDRVTQACRQAAGLWQGAQAHAAAARSVLETQSRAPRFGEVQLERTVAALRELQGQRRVLDVAARLLSGWEQLSLLLGQPDDARGRALDDTAQALADGVAADRTLAAALSRCLDEAKAPEYVGKAEFTTNLVAGRELVEAIAKDALTVAGASLARAGAALVAPRADEDPLALLLQVDAQARVLAVREAATSPAER